MEKFIWDKIKEKTHSYNSYLDSLKIKRDVLVEHDLTFNQTILDKIQSLNAEIRYLLKVVRKEI